MASATTVVGRYTPSPSGAMHVGNARTALLAWLQARSAGGRVLLRIDLDRERCRPEYEGWVREDLAWLGLDWGRVDTTPVRAGRRVRGARREGARLRVHSARARRCALPRRPPTGRRTKDRAIPARAAT